MWAVGEWAMKFDVMGRIGNMRLPDGKTTVNHRNAGDIVFNLANRSHSEELVKGEQAGIMLELK